MNKNCKPDQLYNSGKDRIERDAYYTEAWLTGRSTQFFEAR